MQPWLTSTLATRKPDKAKFPRLIAAASAMLEELLIQRHDWITNFCFFHSTHEKKPSFSDFLIRKYCLLQLLLPKPLSAVLTQSNRDKNRSVCCYSLSQTWKIGCLHVWKKGWKLPGAIFFLPQVVLHFCMLIFMHVSNFGSILVSKVDFT